MVTWQMFDFQRYIRSHPPPLRGCLSSPQSHQQNLSLGTDPIDNAEPCYTHDNIVGSHLCDECMKSILLSVGHKLLSICWLIEQVCSRTRECQVYLFVAGSVFSFASSQCLSTHFWACPSMSWEHATVFAWGFSQQGNFSVAPAEIRDSNMSL